MYKSRFCPSPTGLMHLGNLRTALFNVLLARSHSEGCFLLRIEDTDLLRSKEDYTTKLIEDLRWLGILWQEGPYYQSQRHAIYEKYYQQLLENNQAYWCFCTESELAITRKTQLQAGLPPRYPGTCRHLTPAQIESKRGKGLKPALRFRIPDQEIVAFEDFIQGSKTFATEDIGDFIIQKADHSASFMFCNAVDDALMQVTHVMRGEDHLTNTPRQLLILRTLQLTPPQYGHMPLILGFDGKPLSKRNGSEAVETLRAQGYFPIAIANYLSRLGHHIESDALLSLEALSKAFSVSHVGRSSARFDMNQLRHWQKEAVLHQEEDALWEWIKPSVEKWVTPEKAPAFVSTVKQNILFPEEAAVWAERLLSEDFMPSSLELLEGDFLIALEAAIEKEGTNYAAMLAILMEKTQKKGKALFLPLRLILTGSSDGPELAKVFSLLGKELLLRRVKNIKKKYEKA